MMPQMEANEPLRESSGSTYGQYEGDQAYARQNYQQPPIAEPVGKIYAQPRDNKNILRLIITVIAMVLLIPFAGILRLPRICTVSFGHAQHHRSRDHPLATWRPCGSSKYCLPIFPCHPDRNYGREGGQRISTLPTRSAQWQQNSPLFQSSSSYLEKAAH